MPFPSPRDLPKPGIEPGSPALEADTLNSEPPGKPMNVFVSVNFIKLAIIVSDQIRSDQSLSRVQLFATP